MKSGPIKKGPQVANQAQERAEAIAKIRKLRNQTIDRGRTEAEATMAMNKMSELMEVFDITMDEVALGNIEFVQEHIAVGSTKTDFMNNVLVKIGEFTGTVVWKGQEPGTSRVHTAGWKTRRMMAYFFFGAKEDVEMALYLYDVIKNMIETETERYRKSLKTKRAVRGEKRSLAHGFQMGLVYRVNRELESQAEARIDKFESTGTDMIVVKDRKINDELKKRGINLRKSYSAGRRINQRGFAAGNTAGSSLNLSRPINSGPGGQLLLK